MTTTATIFEQKDTTTTNERNYNIWTDNKEWCTQCNNKLHFDEQTKTTTCTKCGHTQTYGEKDWKILQTQRYIINQYMPGKYFFNNLSAEEIFKKYLREINHTDWSSWLIHDYLLARMRNDKTVQDKLQNTAKQIVEKMNYDPKPWKNLFEKMDAQDPEIFDQVPQIVYENAEKHLREATSKKEDLTDTIHSYLIKLTNIYCYSRWQGDRVACWITSEVIKLCDVDNYTTEFYTDLFNCDPMLKNFKDDMIAGKKREINTKETYIQWELNQSDIYLTQSSALVAVQAAFKALIAKLGIHELWPPTKVLNFDINTVKKVTQLFNDPELFRFYNLSIELNTIDPAKACYYANLFITKTKKMLPNVTSIEQEKAKQAAYIS